MRHVVDSYWRLGDYETKDYLWQCFGAKDYGAATAPSFFYEFMSFGAQSNVMRESHKARHISSKWLHLAKALR